jgi:hypothetical protein
MKIFETPPKSGTSISHPMFLKAWLRMARAWERLTIANGCITWSNGIPTIVVHSTPEGGGADWSEISFGHTLSENTVTIAAGKIRHGTRTANTVTTADVVISGNTWIWVEYPYGTEAATIESGASEPVSDATTLKWPLSYWTYVDSVASLDHICHVGDINIPSVREY